MKVRLILIANPDTFEVHRIKESLYNRLIKVLTENTLPPGGDDTDITLNWQSIYDLSIESEDNIYKELLQEIKESPIIDCPEITEYV